MDDPSLLAWLTFVRALHMGSCLIIAGVWIFDSLIVSRSVVTWRRIAIMLLGIATPLAILSGIAWFVLVTANMTDIPFGIVIHSADLLHLIWTHTRFGRTWQLHLVFGAIATMAAFIGRSFQRLNLVGLTMSLGLVAGLAWAGHGDTGPQPRWHLIADVLHLLACAVWPTGLVLFVSVLISVSRSVGTDRWVTLHQITQRFSTASLIAVGLLTATGLVNGWCLVGSFGALLSTAYGRVLGIKILLFVMMVGLGAINLMILRPKLINGTSTVRKLRLTVMIEIVLGTLLIVIVGLLGVLEPARI